MMARWPSEQVRTKALVIAPVVVLSLLFTGLVAGILIKTDAVTRVSHGELLAAAMVYALAVYVVLRVGHAAVQSLEKIGLTDSLAGVPNRRALHIDAARPHAQSREMALALIDLDGFKMVNDHYGHSVGDRVIKECGRILAELCGKEATSYRLGGDEFAVMVRGPIAKNILESICRNLLNQLASPIMIDDRTIILGASIGLSHSTGSDGLSSSELLRRADVAMYVSKTSGKMRCTWFSAEFDCRREEARQIESDLRKALDADQFRVKYQPLVDAKSGEIVVVEALLRWERPDGIPIGPDVFIPIAEESGLIGAIGLWVLRQACIDALAWEGIKLSVNVSAAQLRDPDFPFQLGMILEETGFPANRLELEVTETYLVVDPSVAARSFDMIKQFGVGVVLDDFGTGYASIGFLRKFQFGKLKLDRSLIVEAATDESSRAMVVSSIAVARAMNMDVTAEGVETEAQLELVRVAGCDQIQGWYFYKAIDAAEVTEQLALAGRRDDDGTIAIGAA
ncbi:putative bifunctional diguanylate cyclase/phosphodiesterase [Tsuneonella mangrovi]|uniref:putative bifunctional diguanylate cyclase/phosphodiesterase n=1 Tax=Tsuneonella mangrovi TaxID=1982042 RepID=UPI001F0AA619|nr:bifunctional diguanylate cyclase/phosphodiesterase [Tsuneonella mangrovi]